MSFNKISHSSLKSFVEKVGSLWGCYQPSEDKEYFYCHPRERGGRQRDHIHHKWGGGDGFGRDDYHNIKRLLAHGDLRFVILLLIEEKPSHGYELIKLIEQKSFGQYSPSAGVIYPTLTYLEEMGFIEAKFQNEKKQYAITVEGVQYLNENRTLAGAILNRLQEMGEKLAAAKTENFADLEQDRSEFRQIFHLIKIELMQALSAPASIKKEILQILKQTLVQVKKLTKGDCDA